MTNGPIYCDATAFVRSRGTVEVRAFGPKDPDHPTVGRQCPACGQPFAAGDYTTLVPLGPGDDKEQQEKARAGRFYNAVAVEVHLACATGHVEPTA
jgi:hypothetical protein